MALVSGLRWQTTNNDATFIQLTEERYSVETKKSLRKFFILLITWLVTIIVIIVGSELYDQHKASEYDDSAVPYIKEVIIPELSKWDPATTKTLMASEVTADISEEKFNHAMTWFSKLGALQSVGDPKFVDVHIGNQADVGVQTIVEYNIDVQYAGGDATINLKLLARDGSFEIYNFNFSSEALLK